MQAVYQPRYVADFHCIASACEDTCCRGWRITIDQESYEKYQRLEQDGQSLFHGKFSRENLMEVAGNSTEVRLDGDTCGFLDEDGLCSIQKGFGEEHLSVTCSTFPRNYSLVNGQLELSLNMACPHAARLALLDDQPMQFLHIDTQADPRVRRIPMLYATDANYPNTRCPSFDQVRWFVISLLQNRNYDFEDRLLILSRFCSDLTTLQLDSNADILALIDEYAQRIDHRGFDSFLGAIPVQPAVLLKSIIDLMEYRLRTGVTGKPFMDCWEQMKKGFGYTGEQTETELVHAYANATPGFYADFFQAHGVLFENYFVNYVFKTLFPFGQQNSIYGKDVFMVSGTVFTELMLLVIQYAMLKALCVGAFSYHVDQFHAEDMIRIIQSFSKYIASDVPYLQTLLKLFEKNHILNFSHAIMLVKS